jgi:hypothetical protein
MTWNIAYTGVMRNAYVILIRKLVEWRPFGRSRCKLEDVLDWILKEKDGMVWNELIYFSTGI